MKKRLKRSRGGFTLIELMVVISIIGLMSSIVMAALNSARVKSDNTSRNQVAEEYRKALGLVYDANGGVYPNTGNTTFYCLGDYGTLGSYTDTLVCGNNLGASENAIVSNAVKAYLPSLPIGKTFKASGGNTIAGPLMGCVSSSCKSVYIRWFLEGAGQTCIRAATAVTLAGAGGGAGATRCDLTLN